MALRESVPEKLSTCNSRLRSSSRWNFPGAGCTASGLWFFDAKIFGFFYRRGRKGRRAATKEKVKNSPRRHEQRTHSKIFGFILNALNLPASVADCARSAPYAV